MTFVFAALFVSSIPGNNWSCPLSTCALTIYLDPPGRELPWCFCACFGTLPFYMNPWLAYPASNYAVLKKISCFRLDRRGCVWQECRAGSRGDPEANHLIQPCELLWLFSEQHRVCMASRSEVAGQAVLWRTLRHTRVHIHCPHSSSAIWYVVRLPCHRTVCSTAVRFRAVICYMGSPFSNTSGMLAVYQLQGCDLVTSC